jgi:hypothetical protein
MAAPLATRLRGTDGAARLSRYLSIALFVVLTALLVEVLFEAWVQELLGNRTVGPDQLLVGDLPTWPKALKNGLLLVLVVLSAAKISVDRRWREFWTRADIALVVLTGIMIVAGLLGTSGPGLIGQAIFVYLRGAIVFYAVRALQPTWPQIKRVLWVVGSAIGLNVAIAVVQMFVDKPAYSGIGWVDLTWATIHRAHGLLDHPNHLGHVLGLVLIGLLAWMTGLPRVTRIWWLAFGAAALGMAATQSRESMLATVAAGVLIWFLRRGGGRTLIIAGTVLVLLFAGNLLVRPGNFDELMYRLRGFAHAVITPSGDEDCSEFATTKECVEAKRVEPREIRLLFIQQGGRLLVHRPLLGYGVGQFGGIVAEQHDPNWELDPRFPGGFNLYDFDGTTVDSFWLHLTVETGVLGLAAYLVWLWLLAVPLLGVTRRYLGRKVLGAKDPRGPTDATGAAAALWGIGALLFTVIVSALSPALEDPLYPPLVFGVIGIAWVLTIRSRATTTAGS